MKRVSLILASLVFMCAAVSANDNDVVAAAKAKNVKAVLSALASGADVNARNENDETALHIASINNDVKMIEILMENGADINAKDGVFGTTPLAFAVIRKNREAVRVLLKYKPDLDYGTSMSPLIFLAVEYGDVAILKMLIGAGINVNKTIDGYQQADNVNALMAASGSGKTEIVKLLLETPIDVNQRDQYGDHCLNWAIFYDQYHILPILLDSKRNIVINYAGYGGQTALDMAIAKKHAKSIDLLKRKGGKSAEEL